MANNNSGQGSRSKRTITYVIIAAIVVICCFNGCSNYNAFVTESQNVDQAWAKVENQYQRRLDLIPNLVETVKGYAQHESSTFEKVTAMRAGLSEAYNQAKDLEGGDMTSEEAFSKYNQAQSNLNKAFNLYINAVHEAYPELKANENFKDLQVQLEGTENRIATERTYYTETVKAYNLMVMRFPANIWAKIFGFHQKPQFAAEEGANKAPKVSF